MTFTEALVGGDGAGKTTIGKALEASGDPVACRYIYMGQSVQSSDRPLPTSRLVRSVRDRPASAAVAKVKPKEKKKRSRLRIAASMANRIAEATWRRVLIWRATRRGLVVISDRHFLFEAATYAPPEVMFARKGETSVRRLGRRRDAIIAQGERTPNFVRVDSDRPLEDVLADVRSTIAGFAATRHGSASLPTR